MELIPCDCRRQCDMKSCSCVKMGMSCACANKEDPDQAVIYDAAGNAESTSGSEDKNGEN